MLEWKLMTGQEKFNARKKDMERIFDSWFADCWAHKCSKEQMLSSESPLPHVYALMRLPVEEAKEISPSDYYEECSSCGGKVDVWLETTFSFCHEYGCGLSLCPRCAMELKGMIERFEEVQNDGNKENL